MTVFALSHAASVINVANHKYRCGALLVLFLLALTESNDIAQYLWENPAAEEKWSPKVSPGKTLEGLMGGVITIMIASLIIGPVTDTAKYITGIISGFVNWY